jgi:FkbM family methyltransferase
MLPRVNLVRAEGADFLLFSNNDMISRAIYQTGRWLDAIANLALLLVEEVDQPLILDIGANLGGYAVPIAQKLAPSGGTVYAYEPQRIVYYQLCGNVFLNRLDNCYPVHMALGETSGQVEIPEIDYNQSSNNGAFSLIVDYMSKQPSIVAASGESKQIVALRRLDDLQFPRKISLIKIDVEGLELAVLRGAPATLQNSGYPPLLLEAWTADWFVQQRRELCQFLENLGYQLFFFGDEILAQHPSYPLRYEFTMDKPGVLTAKRLKAG